MSADGSTYSFDFHELVADSFAGGGGASTGIRMALGRCPDIAVNHDGDALAMHEVNHPNTVHIREDVWAVDPMASIGHRQVGLLWASPDCKHFSKAKGGKPVSKKIRGLAWVVCKWAAKVKPRVIIMENVEEFRTWGPLHQVDGQWFPDPARKGETFERFTARLRRHGYQLEHRELRACDYGAPTIRKRLFLIARRDDRPIVWPAPTHGNPKSLAVQLGKLPTWRTAAECIDWSIPCPSIFERKKPLAEATLRRIARGVMRYVVNAETPFIVRVDQTSAAGRNGVGDIQAPLNTVHTVGSHALVVPHIAPLTHHGDRPGVGMTDPLPTITGAHRGEQALIAATLMQAAHGEGKPGGVQRWGDGTADIEQPVKTITASNGHAVIAAVIERQFGGSAGNDASAPLGTTTAGGGGKSALVTAFLAQHNTMPNGGIHAGRPVSEPVSTVIASGSQQSVVTSHLIKLRGTCQDGQPIDQPAPTVTASGTHAGEVRASLVKYYGNERDGVALDEPMHTIPTKDRLGLVMVHGEPYQIVDIGMRMLTPRELATAQGFPADYIIDRRPDGTPLTKTAQVRMIGNSVCPPVAAALVAANFQHERQPSRSARRAA